MFQKVVNWLKGQRKQNVIMAVLILLMTLICAFIVQSRLSGGMFAKESLDGTRMQADESEDKNGTQNKSEAEKTEEEKEIAAVEASIVPGQYPIMGMSSIRQEQMAAYFNQSQETYPGEILGEGGAPDIETFCQIYYE